MGFRSGYNVFIASDKNEVSEIISCDNIIINGIIDMIGNIIDTGNAAIRAVVSFICRVDDEFSKDITPIHFPNRYVLRATRDELIPIVWIEAHVKNMVLSTISECYYFFRFPIRYLQWEVDIHSNRYNKTRLLRERHVNNTCASITIPPPKENNKSRDHMQRVNSARKNKFDWAAYRSYGMSKESWLAHNWEHSIREWLAWKKLLLLQRCI